MTEDVGSALAFQLLYSGNFEGFVQKNQLNEVRVGLGINPENFAWELEPNQSFDTPVAMISYSHKGLTGLSQESQAFVQNHITVSYTHLDLYRVSAPDDFEEITGLG